MSALILLPLVIVFLAVVAYLFYWATKESGTNRPERKLKHPTEWEKILERAKRKRGESDQA